MAAPNESLRRLVVLCAASACWAFSFGLEAPLASLWLRDHGYDDAIIGRNTSTYYLGIALAAGLVPWTMRRWGRASVVFGTLASGVTVMAFPFRDGLPWWFAFRLLNGFAGALSLIPMETLVNNNAQPDQRARHFAYYAVCVAVGIAAGELVGMQMYAGAPYLAFLVGGAAALLAAAVLVAGLRWPVLAEEPRQHNTPLDFRRNLLCFGSAWSQGYLEGGMVSLLPVYLLAVGFSDKAAGWLLGGIMIGVILFQVPLAWVADRVGRGLVLLACYAVTGAALVLLLFFPGAVWLTVLLVLAGACSGAFYPLGLALLGERMPPAAVPRASAWFLAINCVGSVTGPAVIGEAMNRFGDQAMFWAGLAAVVLVTAAWAAVQVHERWRGSAFGSEGAAVESPRAAAVQWREPAPERGT
jgi:MFS family permease